jgi:hypothetical protein
MMTRSSDSRHEEITQSLHELAAGKVVKRTRHELIVDGVDYTDRFVEVLKEIGYVPLTVAEVPVEPGERIPAFFIEDSVAYFGWIFYEKFSGRRVRKLWGSAIRNRKGDWAIQISPKKGITLYANINQKTDMDIDRPTDW